MSVSSGFAMLAILRAGLALFRDRRRLDEIELGKVLFEIGVALTLNAPLVGSVPVRGALAIAAIERVHHLHAGDDLAEGRKALAVEPGIVAEIDEHLRRARIWSGGGEGDRSALIALFYGIILDVGIAPGAGGDGIAVDAELHHEALDHADDARIVVNTVLDQIVEAIGAAWRPVAMNRDHERAFARVEFRLVTRGGFGVERGGIGEVAGARGARPSDKTERKRGQRKADLKSHNASLETGSEIGLAGKLLLK